MPQRGRVLGARHRDLHDPGRRLHPPLRLLQRPDGRADMARPARAGAGREPGEEDGPRPRGHHLGRSRRPARLRRLCLRRRDPLDPPDGARLQGRDPHPRLPRAGDAAGQGDPRAPRRLQPQRRDGAAPLPEGAPRLRVHALGAGPADGEGDGRRRRRHQVGPDGRPGRELRRDGRDVRGSCATTRCRSSPSGSTCARPRTTSRSSATGTPTSSRRSRMRRTRWASTRSHQARWSGARTTRTRRRPRPRRLEPPKREGRLPGPLSSDQGRTCTRHRRSCRRLGSPSSTSAARRPGCSSRRRFPSSRSGSRCRRHVRVC